MTDEFRDLNPGDERANPWLWTDSCIERTWCGFPLPADTYCEEELVEQVCPVHGTPEQIAAVLLRLEEDLATQINQPSTNEREHHP